jgi:hypothetical protein
LAVNGDAWNMLWKSGSKPAGTSDTARLRSNRVNVAKDDVVNSVGVDTGALDEGFDAVSTDIGGVNLGKSATTATNRGADSVNDVSVRSTHTPTLLPLPFSELSRHSVLSVPTVGTESTEWVKWVG